MSNSQADTAVAAPVSAWEFDMNGLWRWNFDYIAGGGNNGFFGQNNIVNPALVGGPNWAAMNAWVGARKINGQQYGLVTGKDASLATVRAEFLPEFRINNAVRLRGNYQIGGPDHNSIATIPGQALAEASYGLYPTGLNFGKWNVMSTGSWTDFLMSAQTPWGILIAGKREAPWGIGAQYDGGQASSESLGIVAPYGPFRFGLFFQPWAGQTWFNSQVGPQTIFTVSVADAQAFNGTQMLNTNYKLWDNEAKRQVQPLVFVTYDNADLSAGVLYEWFGLHNGPAGAQTEAFATTTARTYDGTREDGSAFLKYNNGRFFTNMELAWTRSQITSQPGMTDGVTSFGGGYGAVYNPGPADGYFLSFNESAAPRYTETWKWMMEIGALCGPAKLTALWSWVPGPDRRGGVWIDNQSWDNVFANPQAFLPYSMLMGYQYGGGLNAVSRNGEGYMSDANSFGVRLDYALAANLNLYFTGFYATRASNGWPWGVMTVQQEMVEPMIANGNTSHTSTGLPINFSTGGGNALLMGQGRYQECLERLLRRPRFEPPEPQ